MEVPLTLFIPFSRRLALPLLLTLCPFSQALASGYGLFTQGASAFGQAAAVTAHTNSPSTLFYNPALLTTLDGTRVEAGVTVLTFDRRFTSSFDGDTHDMRDETKMPASFYLSHRFRDDLAAGIGVFFPFGLASDWPEQWEGRFLATRTEITTYTVNPAIAWQPLPRLSIAAGLDLVLFDATLRRHIDLTPLGLTGVEARQEFAGDDNGLGWNLGLALQLTDRLNFGASWRSEVDLSVDGDARFSGVPGVAAALFPATGGRADLTLPEQLSFGLAWQPIDPLVVEIGAHWEGWSAFETMRVGLDHPVAGASEDLVARDWDDTWSFNIGGRYAFNDWVALLAGYKFGNTPVPNSTFEPAIPDANTHLWTVGADLQLGAATVSLSYGFQHYTDRTKNNTVGADLAHGVLAEPGAANGLYQSEIHLVALSLGWHF
jgi:long-chain fatty acid transport protein